MSQALRKTVWQFLNGKKQLQITYVINNLYPEYGGFPGGSLVKSPPANAGDIRDEGSIPGSGRSLEEGNGNSLQYSCMENIMDKGAWQATFHWVT